MKTCKSNSVPLKWTQDSCKRVQWTEQKCYANSHNLYIRLGGRPAAFNILIGAWVDMSITQTEAMCSFSHRLSAHYVGRIFREASIIFSSSCKRTTRSQPRYASRWQSPNRHGVHVFVDETNRYAHQVTQEAQELAQNLVGNAKPISHQVTQEAGKCASCASSGTLSRVKEMPLFAVVAIPYPCPKPG